MSLVARRTVTLALLLALYLWHPVLGLTGLAIGFGYLLLRRFRQTPARPAD